MEVKYKKLDRAVSDLCQGGMDVAAAFKAASETFNRGHILSFLGTDTSLGGFGAFEYDNRAERLSELKRILIEGLGFDEQEAKDWIFKEAAEGASFFDDADNRSSRVEFRDVLLSNLGFSVVEVTEKFKEFGYDFNCDELN